MKNKIFILSVVAAVVFTTACSNTGSSSTANQKPTLASDTASLKYQCPMKCQGDTAYKTAGQCPVCGMDLKEMDEDHRHK
jgi:Cu2+-exporting ATPase